MATTLTELLEKQITKLPESLQAIGETAIAKLSALGSDAAGKAGEEIIDCIANGDIAGAYEKMAPYLSMEQIRANAQAGKAALAELDQDNYESVQTWKEFGIWFGKTAISLGVAML